MTPRDLHTTIIVPALDLLAQLGGPRRSHDAERLLLAISGQEAGFEARVQVVKRTDGTWIDGPARGLWQFEAGGGVKGVLTHPASHALALRLCSEREVDPSPTAVHLALMADDVLAAGFARLLLWADPQPLPDDQLGGWKCYLRCWRPGKPRPAHWGENWAKAIEVVDG